MRSSFLTSLSAACCLLAALSCVSARAQQAPAMPTRTSMDVQSGMLSATVVDAMGHPASGGVVSFVLAGGEPGKSLGSAVLDGGGHATLAVGAQATRQGVRASYRPADSSLLPSTSGEAAMSGDVTGVPSFSVTATPSSLTTVQGGYATTVLTVTPINNFSESVTLSCSGQPAQATCNFTPVIGSTAPTGTNTQPQPFTSTLQISTEAASGVVALPSFGLPRGPLPTALAMILPGILALVGVAATRRRAFHGGRVLSLVLLLGAATLSLSGCSQRYGYLKHPPSVAGGTPLGTYTILVSAYGNDGATVTTIPPISITFAVTAAK